MVKTTLESIESMRRGELLGARVASTQPKKITSTNLTSTKGRGIPGFWRFGMLNVMNVNNVKCDFVLGGFSIIFLLPVYFYHISMF